MLKKKEKTGNTKDDMATVKGNRWPWFFPKINRLKVNDKVISKSVDNGLAQISLTTSNFTVGLIGLNPFDKVDATLNTNQLNGGDHVSIHEDAMLKHVEENIIGKDLVYEGPFGKRKVVYCDYTASGKSITFIEDYIRKEVLPYYGNTHTTTTISSLQTSTLRTEAKQIIRKCINATEEDAVIFVSSGTTGAVLKLIHALELNDSPVVFISPFEHHSNLLPWLEIGAEVIYGEEDSNGQFDLFHLDRKVKEYSKTGRPLVGSFSAASNITGILNDTEELAIIMHRYNGYAFFDYATAGPYVELDMNPNNSDSRPVDPLSYKDAIFCSIHKFVGGPGTPGLLVAKKNLFINEVPSDVGGGTVLYVTHNKHEYVKDIEEREEGGTPAIVESIRAGLVFQLKLEITPGKIMKQEHKLVNMAYEKWATIDTLHILGKSSAERLPIFSLVFEHPTSKRFLHHNFIASLFNDLFGIQARGGCACAGPYAEDLLGISKDFAGFITGALNGDYTILSDRINNDEMRELQGKKFNILKPGFTRLNLPFFLNDAAIQFILDAVVFVAEHGWKFLSLYEMDPNTGDFKHQDSQVTKISTHLADVKDFMKLPLKAENVEANSINVISFQNVLEDALAQVKNLENTIGEKVISEDKFLPQKLDQTMRWFLLPAEACILLKGKTLKSSKNYNPSFYPRQKIMKFSTEKKLNRTRMKSGLKNLKFCICEMKRGRHVHTSRCKKYEQDTSKIELDNNNNINNIDSGKITEVPLSPFEEDVPSAIR